MADIRLSIVDADGRSDRMLVDSLRRDLDQGVAPTAFAQVPAAAGSKGLEIDVTTLVVGVLSSGAAVGLVNVLKAYVQRVRGSIVIEGPGGKATIETGDIRNAIAVIDDVAPRILSAPTET